MRIICNTSPLIGLMKINRIDLLFEIFDEVIIPKAVYDELCKNENSHRQEAETIKSLVANGKLTVYNVANEIAVRTMFGKLHYGELEVIVGAKELNLDFAVIDEKAARKTASAFLIKTIGILGILLLAKEKKILPLIKPEIDKLRGTGYRISENLYERILHDAGE